MHAKPGGLTRREGGLNRVAVNSHPSHMYFYLFFLPPPLLNPFLLVFPR
jgi:hypothetical protein